MLGAVLADVFGHQQVWKGFHQSSCTHMSSCIHISL